SAPAITTTPAAAGYTEVLTSGEWSFVKTLPDDIAEGLGWRLHVLAEDASGNRTDPGVAASVVFDVDRSDPVASETTYISAEIVNIKTSFSLEGEAIDSHGIFSLTVSQKQDDGAVVPINTNGPTLGGTVTNRTWTLANLPRNPADIGVATTVNGVYEYIITATDLAGKTHSVTRRLRFDTIGPELTVVSPADAYWSPAATIAFNGVASDLTAVDKVYYQRTAESVVVAPDIPADPGVEANWTGAGVGGGWTLVTGKNTWNFSLTEAGEGRQKVWLAAVDTAANPSYRYPASMVWTLIVQPLTLPYPNRTPVFCLVFQAMQRIQMLWPI
ncbi:MAG TPA: hypothetical protein PKH81_00780, partial [Treponemataceae bacterium]|nr:hypothetical protein [Treponemataceae bacterium]